MTLYAYTHAQQINSYSVQNRPLSQAPAIKYTRPACTHSDVDTTNDSLPTRQQRGSEAQLPAGVYKRNTGVNIQSACVYWVTWLQVSSSNRTCSISCNRNLYEKNVAASCCKSLWQTSKFLELVNLYVCQRHKIRRTAVHCNGANCNYAPISIARKASMLLWPLKQYTGWPKINCTFSFAWR